MAAPAGKVEAKETLKRKRETDDNLHSDRIPQPRPPQSGNGAPINYLARPHSSKLGLMQGDSETFADVLSLINDYEGVLGRRESLAANLGAKLTAPRLLRAMENMFEGSINAVPVLVEGDATTPTTRPTWMDIVDFAKSNPASFNLTTTADKGHVCQFSMEKYQVEISEDDWRLIKSGAADRFLLVPHHPVDEDESAELTTLEILEKRLQTLIMRADEVARKARQLNYKLSGRKAAINNARRLSPTHGPVMTGFSPVNPASRPAVSPSYDLHADLLQQFLAPRPLQAQRSLQGQTTSKPFLPGLGSRPSPALGGLESPQPTSCSPLPGTGGTDDSSAGAHRPALIQARLDKLSRGAPIAPPCDRCRRLSIACIKHLTACQGCTRKHAKCSWKAVTDHEAATLRADLGSPSVEGGASRSSATFIVTTTAGFAGRKARAASLSRSGDEDPVEESDAGPDMTANREGEGVGRRGSAGTHDAAVATATADDRSEGARLLSEFSTRSSEERRAATRPGSGSLPGLRLPASYQPRATASGNSSPGMLAGPTDGEEPKRERVSPRHLHGGNAHAQSRLSHMASVASAAAEATSASRRSSVGREGGGEGGDGGDGGGG